MRHIGAIYTIVPILFRCLVLHQNFWSLNINKPLHLRIRGGVEQIMGIRHTLSLTQINFENNSLQAHRRTCEKEYAVTALLGPQKKRVYRYPYWHT